MNKRLLLYIHGFQSSPQSLKAIQLKEYCEHHHPDIKLVIPQLPYYPQEAADVLKRIVEEHQAHYQIGVVGSSLGGFLSIWLQNKYSLPLVAINPAITPHLLLKDFLGEQTNPYTQDVFLLKAAHIDELKALRVNELPLPNKAWLLQQEGDEVLNYHEAVDYFHLAKNTIEPDGNHSFIGFERFLPSIISFLYH
ncbi:esterase YqiA [Vibrio sp.]|nr:esterase YqiA [Vibrio sp.]